jgi:membrane dipeptidase
VIAKAQKTYGLYDFGLSAEQEDRAARLHTNSIVVDMLSWGPFSSKSFDDDKLRALAEREEAQGRDAAELLVEEQLRSLALDDPEAHRALWDETGITVASREVDLRSPASNFARATREFDQLPWLVKALRADDIRIAKSAGLHAGFLNTQDVGSLTADDLQTFYDLGLRMVMPTYNSQNHLGTGCTDRSDGGLSRAGVKLIERMNDLGMIVDGAHCGRRTTLDMCDASTAPVIASHTTAEAVFFHDRAKSDDEIVAIAATGGIVGVVTLPDFLGPGVDVSVEATLDHIDHIAHLVGWRHVGIGTDWPMQYPDWWIRRLFAPHTWERDGWEARHFGEGDVARTLIGFEDSRDFPNITRGLVSRGYSDEEIRGILGENFVRVFEAVCG